MFASKYDARVVELFKSGKATPAHWAEMVEGIGCASEKDTQKVRAIHDAIGFTAEEKVYFNEEDARSLPERVAALAAAGTEDEKMRMIAGRIEATRQKADRAGDRKWRSTMRKLGFSGGRRTRGLR